MLIAIAAVAIAPILLSYAFYYLFPRGARVNYGELLPTKPFPAIVGTRADGTAFRLDDLRGRWVMVMAAPGACATACERMLYATRQARTMQNKDEERIVRLWVVSDEVEPARALLAQHPDLMVARAPAAIAAALPRAADAIYLVDPLGNQVLAWPADPDIKALSRDVARLLKASQIG